MTIIIRMVGRSSIRRRSCGRGREGNGGLYGCVYVPTLLPVVALILYIKVGAECFSGFPTRLRSSRGDIEMVQCVLDTPAGADNEMGGNGLWRVGRESVII